MWKTGTRIVHKDHGQKPKALLRWSQLPTVPVHNCCEYGVVHKKYIYEKDNHLEISSILKIWMSIAVAINATYKIVAVLVFAL